MEVIVHCHHYNARIQRTIEGAAAVDGKGIFVSVSESVFARHIANVLRPDDDAAQRLAVIEGLYAHLGFGRLHLDGLASGTLRASESHYVEGWAAGFPERVDPEKKVRRDVDIRDPGLRSTLDQRLARTAYRELRKVTGFEVTHRETYKLVGYRGQDGGHYIPHRDTYFPLGHRRYSLSVALTDDFEGGGLYFPEYTQDVYRPASGTAAMFPCTLMHGVAPVVSGLRLAIVAFLYDEAGARVKRRHEQAAGMGSTERANRMTTMVDLPGVPESDIVWKVDGGD